MANIPIPFGEQQYLNPQGKLELPIGGHTSKYPSTGDPRFDNLPEEQKDRIFQGMMGDLVPEGGLVDLDTGAPTDVRGKVGALLSFEDRMRAMKTSFPEGDVQPYGEDNFLFTSPQSGMRTVFNPAGLDVGDFPGAAPEIAGAAGSTLGALAGVAGGPAGMIAGAGIGGQAAREATRYGIQKYTGEPDTRETRDRLLQMGSEAAIDAAGQGLGMAVPGAARAVFGARPGRNAGQLIQDFTDIGAPLEAATITGNPALRGIAGGTAAGVGGEPIERAVTGMQSAVQRRVQRETDALAPGGVGTKMQTGGVVQRGVDAAEARFRRVQERLYNAAYNLIGRDTPVDLQAVQALRVRLTQLNTDTNGALNPRVAPIIAEIDRILAPVAPPAQTGMAGMMQQAGRGPARVAVPQPQRFEGLRAIRTEIGKELDDPAAVGTSGTLNKRALRQVYGALTEDMNRAASQAGAQREITAADRFTREFNADQGPGPLLTKVRDADSPERAFDIVRGARGSELMQLRRQLGQQDWDQFVATVLESMGRAKPSVAGAAGLGGPAGDFSVATFLTNWNKIAEQPEVRQALFGGRNYAALRTALDRLVRVSTAIRDTAPNVMPTSGSPSVMRAGPFAQLSSALGGMQQMTAGNVKTGSAMVAGALAPFLTSRLMTNARFVNWLVGARTAAQRQGVEGLGPWIGRLSSVAVAEPKLKDDVEELMRAMTGRVLTTGRPKMENVSTGGIRG